MLPLGLGTELDTTETTLAVAAGAIIISGMFQAVRKARLLMEKSFRISVLGALV